jgi:hypothetical protein
MNRILRISELILALAIVCTCKREQEQNPSTDITYNDCKGLILAGGGRIILNDPNSLLNGVSVDIPQCTLGNPVTISINENKSSDIFVSLEHSVTHLLEPVNIGILYKSDGNSDSLQVNFYGETEII